jgi:hypothetical protein
MPTTNGCVETHHRKLTAGSIPSCGIEARSGWVKESVMNRTYLFVAAGAVAISTPALAGELNGVGRDNPLQGASICQFSGLNDDPDSTNPENPGGRTQSYGQDVKFGRHDPLDEEDPFRPGNLCNPNNLPMKPIGGL